MYEDIYVIMAMILLQNENPPHAYHCIEKNLNKGMVSHIFEMYHKRQYLIYKRMAKDTRVIFKLINK